METIYYSSEYTKKNLEKFLLARMFLYKDLFQLLDNLIIIWQFNISKLKYLWTIELRNDLELVLISSRKVYKIINAYNYICMIIQWKKHPKYIPCFYKQHNWVRYNGNSTLFSELKEYIFLLLID